MNWNDYPHWMYRWRYVLAGAQLVIWLLLFFSIGMIAVTAPR